jgi:3-oxoacyl-[acyl-carrier protein] reductase
LNYHPGQQEIDMTTPLSGDSALVTASSSGLGKASATSLVRDGADVVLNGRDEQRLEAAAEDVRAAGPGRVVTHQGDITVKEDIEELVETAVSSFGGLDHVVTSAGGPPSGPFLDIDDDQWYAAFDLLVMSVVRTVRAAESHLRDGGGTVTMITSTSVKEPMDELVLSNSVRMGVIGLEKTLSRELAPEVRVNAVLPGGHETARNEQLVEQGLERGQFDSYEDGLRELHEGVPLERIGQPEELGDTVAFLCSDRASYINGVALPVDGGLLGSSL